MSRLPNKCQLIVLGGVPRSGKTTLARRLVEEFSLTHMAVDADVSAFSRFAPEKAIRHMSGDDGAVARAVEPYVFHKIRWHITNHIPLVVDGYHIGPLNLHTLLPRENYRAVFLGYQTPDPAFHLERIRRNQRPEDWTNRFSDEQILSFFTAFVASSRRFEEECGAAGVPYLQVGDDLAPTSALMREMVLG